MSVVCTQINTLGIHDNKIAVCAFIFNKLKTTHFACQLKSKRSVSLHFRKFLQIIENRFFQLNLAFHFQVHLLNSMPLFGNNRIRANFNPRVYSVGI